jgi:hypothetical protein
VLDILAYLIFCVLCFGVGYALSARQGRRKATPRRHELSLGYTALMFSADDEAESEQYPDGYNLQVVSQGDPPVVRVEHPVQAGQRAYCRTRPSAQGVGLGTFRGDDDNGCARPCGHFVDLTPLQRGFVDHRNGLVAGLVFEPQEEIP